MNLDPSKKKVHSGTEIIAKKKAEYKFLGQTFRRPGLKLWGFDTSKNMVYEIQITPKKSGETVDLKGNKIKGGFEVKVNTDHKSVWALNEQNAVKKFKKLLG